MLKVAHPREDHGHATGVCRGDDFGVLDGATGLNRAGGTGVGGSGPAGGGVPALVFQMILQFRPVKLTARQAME